MADSMETKEKLKLKLLKQYKSYRNYALKIGLLLGSVAFACHFCFVLATQKASMSQIEDAFIQGSFTAMAFSILGYCIGSFIGASLQRRHYMKLAEMKENRRRMLDEELALRHTKLEALEKENNISRAY